MRFSIHRTSGSSSAHRREHHARSRTSPTVTKVSLLCLLPAALAFRHRATTASARLLPLFPCTIGGAVPGSRPVTRTRGRAPLATGAWPSLGRRARTWAAHRAGAGDSTERLHPSSAPLLPSEARGGGARAPSWPCFYSARERRGEVEAEETGSGGWRRLMGERRRRRKERRVGGGRGYFRSRFSPRLVALRHGDEKDVHDLMVSLARG